jgi:hypothetical protein
VRDKLSLAFSATLSLALLFLYLSFFCFSFCLGLPSLTGDFPEIGSRAMSKSTEQEVFILSSSKHGLVYLTSNDWALVADKATRARFNKGDILVQRDKRANGVFLLLKGTARVQIPFQSTIPAIGPGEICGEMSFLEDAPASASVVAETDVEAYHLDRPTLQSMFELFPHLASRFYRSLATNLSRRLRDLIGPTS